MGGASRTTKDGVIVRHGLENTHVEERFRSARFASGLSWEDRQKGRPVVEGENPNEVGPKELFLEEWLGGSVLRFASHALLLGEIGRRLAEHG